MLNAQSGKMYSSEANIEYILNIQEEKTPVIVSCKS